MKNPFLFIFSLLGGMAVALGAFGAHALKDALEASGRTEVWKTAVFYHLVHAALMAAMSLQKPGDYRYIYFAFLGGIVLFSTPLYALSLSAPGWVGAITPVGGLLLIAGWCGLAYKACYPFSSKK